MRSKSWSRSRSRLNDMRESFDASSSVLACLCIMIPNVSASPFKNKGERRRKGKLEKKCCESAITPSSPTLVPLLEMLAMRR